ncbi:MAG: hypothetical protein Ct9H90mP9_2890 [Pseudomonadota bacterium]|nr:MAG: hypothetical protein Ct9H90mP9_2890 [Pseudomonadota bacterium]
MQGIVSEMWSELEHADCLCNEEIEDHPFAVLKGIGSEFENFQK